MKSFHVIRKYYYYYRIFIKDISTVFTFHFSLKICPDFSRENRKTPLFSPYIIGI